MRHPSLVVAIAVSCMATVASTQAAVIEVDCKGPGFRTIQEGVDAAADGDVIVIAPCVYEEQVTVQDKNLTFLGSGVDVTKLVWDGDGCAMSVSNLIYPQEITVTMREISVTSSCAVSWEDCVLRFECCAVNGKSYGGLLWGGGATVVGSTIEYLYLSRSHYYPDPVDVEVFDSRIGFLHMGRIPEAAGLSLTSSLSRYGELSGRCLEAHCVSDSMGTLTLRGIFDPQTLHQCASTFYGLNSTVDLVEGFDSPAIGMEFCEIGDLTHRFRGPGGGLSLYSCLVSGSVLTEVEFVGAGSGSGGARDSREYQRGRGLSHNTILGDLTLCCAATVRSNVVSGRAELFGGDGYVISHNDFVGGLVVTSPGDSVYANISEPPLFCYPAGGDYTLQDCSPCVGAAHDGGDIGAFGVDCECMVVVEHKSWGAVKAMYR